MKSLKYNLVILILISLFGNCTSNNEPEKTTNAPVTTPPKIPEPFHYKKNIEVKPGLIFDVLSWGRGADTTGAYIILRSDSTHRKFSSVTGELKGNIVDVWNMDMDADGSPEIFIQAADKKSWLNMYVNEFDNSGSSQKLHFPDLSDATKAKYRGKDSLYVKNGKLIREFPLFKKGDPDNKPSGGKKVLVYSLTKNDFSIGELDPKTMQPIKSPPPPPKKVVPKKRSGRRRR